MGEKWTPEREADIKEVAEVAKETGVSYKEAKEVRDDVRKESRDDEITKKGGKS